MFEQRETSHRIIMGKEYYEDFGLQPQQALDRAFAFLLSKKVPRQTEGDSQRELTSWGKKGIQDKVRPD